MILYLIKFTLLFALMLAAYLLLLKADKRFVFNRAYLWGALACALLLPAISLPQWYEEPVFDAEVLETWTTVGPAVADTIAGEQSSADEVVIQKTGYSWWLIAWLAGSALMVIRLLANLYALLRITARSKRLSAENRHLYQSDEATATFSFFQRIIVPAQDDPVTDEVVAHEMIHVKHWHSLDMMMIELLLSVAWFHPLLWVFRREVRLNHEYTADFYPSAADKNGYCLQLIHYPGDSRTHTGGVVGSNFSYLSIKNRIQMINQNKKSRRAFYRNVLLILFLMIPAVLSLSFMQVHKTPVIDDTDQFTVVIDAGHGGIDPGAKADFNDVTESALNLMLVQEIKAMGSDKLNLVFTRDGDDRVSLADRTRLTKQHNADFFLSIHCNFTKKGTPTGFSAFVGHEQSEQSQSLVDMLMQSIIANSDHYLLDRSEFHTAIEALQTQKASFFVLKNTECPAVMLHFGSVNNEKEQALITDADSRKAIAKVILSSLEQLSEESTK